MTLILGSMTGWNKDFGSIEYVSPWSNCFSQAGGMKFYQGDCKMIVDINLEGKDYADLRVTSYSHNDKDAVSRFASKHKDNLRKFLLDKLEIDGRKYYAVELLESGFSELTKQDFCNYSPALEIRDELFIFEREEDDGGFPKMYFMRREQRMGAHEDTLYVFSQSSRFLFPSVASSTSVGKQFCYILFNSFRRGKFTSKVPDITTMDLPTGNEKHIPRSLNTEKLFELAEKMQTTLSLNTKSQLPTVTTSLFSDDTDDDTIDAIDDDITARTVEEVHQQESILEIVKRMARSIIDNDSINLYDIYALGFQETLREIPETGTPIHVELDMPSTVKRMCINSGKFHVVPQRAFFSASEDFGENDDIFVICNEDNFPKKLSTKKIH